MYIFSISAAHTHTHKFVNFRNFHTFVKIRHFFGNSLHFNYFSPCSRFGLISTTAPASPRKSGKKLRRGREFDDVCAWGKMKLSVPGGGFRCFMFLPLTTWENDPDDAIWRAYFSNGLKHWGFVVISCCLKTSFPVVAAFAILEETAKREETKWLIVSHKIQKKCIWNLNLDMIYSI